jgi:hypothetical protein
LDPFLVSNPNDVSDFYQIAVLGSDHDMIFLSCCFMTRPLLNGAGEFAVSRTNNVPEFSFATVSESEICDNVISIRSDGAGVDGIPFSFIKLLFPVVLPVLTHIFNHIIKSSKFPGKSVVRKSFLI